MRKSYQNQDIEQLKQNILSNNTKIAKSAADKLSQIGGDDITCFLMSLIELDNSRIRDIAAIALSDINDNRALEPLLKAIFKKENHNQNGTLVYALESLDCSKNLKDIFKILFYETFEAKIGAYTILTEQTFEFTENDLVEISTMWTNCKLNPSICPGFDDEETKEMMQYAFERLNVHSRNKKPSS